MKNQWRKKRSLFFDIWCSLAFLSAAQAAKAGDVYTFVVKKQEQKQSSHWTLADWLATRDRMRLMDLWLAIHSPSPYEFYLGGDYQFLNENPGRSLTGGKGYLAAYASIFGLEGQIEQSTARFLTAIFHLRLLGFHAQSTNITLQGGLRARIPNDGGDSFRNAFAGVATTLYIAKPFGIEGLYRHYFPSNAIANGSSLLGDRYEAGAFIDFKFTRVYGSYFYEKEILSVGGIPSRSGIFGGLKLFF